MEVCLEQPINDAHAYLLMHADLAEQPYHVLDIINTQYIWHILHTHLLYVLVELPEAPDAL